MTTKKKVVIIVSAAVAVLFVIGVFGLGLMLGMHIMKTGTVEKNINIKGYGNPGDSVRLIYRTKERNPSQKDMEDTIYKLQKRAEMYSTEAEVYQQGSQEIIVEIPGIGEDDIDAAAEVLVSPGSLEFITMGETGQAGEVVLTGRDVEDAKVNSQKSSTGEKEYVVQLILTDNGTSKFAKATEENIGRQIWIMYDEQQLSAPVVQSKIIDGRPVITGMLGQEEAEELAAMIRIGALSLELEEVR